MLRRVPEAGVSRKLASHRRSGPVWEGWDSLLIIVGKLRLDDTCSQLVRFKALDDSEVNMKPGSRLRDTYRTPSENQ